MPKNSKRGLLGSLNVFTNRKLQKNGKGDPSIEFESFRKKSRTAAKKPKGGLLWSRLYFWKHKKICGLVRESNLRSPATQKIS